VTGTNAVNNGNGYFTLTYVVPPVATPTFYWATNTQSWAVATNWSSNQVPVYSNNAFIDNGGTSVLTNIGTVATLTIASSNSSRGILYITNGGSLTASNLIVGSVGAGTVTIGGGGSLISSNITIASGSNSMGVLNVGVLGSNSTGVTLASPTITFGNGTSSLNFNQADTLTNSAIFTGGIVNKTFIAQLGTGTTVLTGVGSSNSASIAVTGGELVFNGGSFNTAGDISVGIYAKASNGVTYSNSQPVSMIITNGAHVTAGYFGIGYGYDTNGNSLGLSNNWVTVTGSTTVLNATTLVVGDGGNSNALNIFNGSTVNVTNTNDGSVTIGNYGNSNSVFVGSNSTLNSITMYVGYNDGTPGQGINNSLIVSNGTVNVTNDLLEIGYAGTSNSVVVTGSQAILNNAGSFYLGDDGTFASANNNTLIVSNGATLYGSSLTAGGDAIGVGGSSNALIITGPGSFYSNSSTLYVGFGDSSSGISGVGNGMILSNGATALINVGGGGSDGGLLLGYTTGDLNNFVTVYGNSTLSVTGDSYIGYGDASSNTVTVTGTNAVWSNNGTLNIGYGTNLGSVGNSLVISNGGAVMAAFVNTSSGTSSDSNNSIIVTGSGSKLMVSGGINLGDNGYNDLLIVTNGGHIYSGGDQIGVNSSGSVAIVTGSNSLWSNSMISVGINSGGGNQLLITNGGHMITASTNTSGAYGIGIQSASNTVIVTGVGSQWLVSGNSNTEFSVGDSGVNNNLLVISNGGLVTLNNNEGVYIGNGNATSNGVIVTGGTLSATNNGAFYVGGSAASQNFLDGSSGTVVITDQQGAVGINGSGNNTALLSGSNSSWSNADTMSIGANGSSSNTLILSNGSTLYSGTGNVGVNGSSDDSVLLTGAGTKWSNSGTITLGNAGGSGSITIGNGASLISSNIMVSGGPGDIGILNVGTYGGSDSNVTLIAQAITFGGGASAVNFNQSGILTNGAIFTGTNSGPYYVTLAQLGSGTTVLTGRGGTNTADVFVEGGQLAFQGAAFNNSTGNIYVGYQGAGNAFGARSNSTSVSMLLSSNAVVKTDALYVGSGAGKGSNSITVTGSSTLTVTNSSYIGYGGSDSNSVTVTGSGSVWSNAGTINVGEGLGNGSVGNSLVISNGGNVIAGYVDISQSGLDSNNSILITGAGSSLGAGSVTIGDAGSGSLTIGSGGTLSASNITVGNTWNIGGTLNVGTLGGSDTNIHLNAQSITVGPGYSSLFFNQADSLLVTSSISQTVLGQSGYGIAMTGLGTTTFGSSSISLLRGQFIVAAGTTIFDNESFLNTGSGFLVGGNGYTSFGGLLTLTNTHPATFIATNGSQIVTGFFLEGNGNQYSASNYIAATGNTAIFTGSNTALKSSGVYAYVGVGADGNNNTLIFSNHASLIFTNDSNSFGFYLGNNGFSNTVIVDNASILIATNAPSGQNALNIGSGAQYTPSSDNVAIFRNGAYVMGSNDLIGYYGNSNQMLVTGVGTIYTNGGYLQVGTTGGSDNSLVVSNGATALVMQGIYLGYTSGNVSNSVTVYGGSTLTSAGTSGIGYGGASGNTVTVTGSNALWSNSGTINVGDGLGNGSVGNSLVITNSGTIAANGYVEVGYTNGDTGNSITVSGTNSKLVVNGSSSDYFDIGYMGSSNSMIVSNGASVVLNSRVNVGHGQSFSPHTIGSSGNILIVTGPGTTFTNSGDYIDVGDWTNSTGNLMVISNQAQVSNANTFYIGWDTASSNNTVIVTGANSRLLNGGDLELGDYGSGNSLVISNGAYASFAGTNYISYYAGSSNNSVLVTGAGSVWSNSSIDLAHNGSGSITIASGASLMASNIMIASNGGSVGILNVGTYGGNDTNVHITTPIISLGGGVASINFNQSDTMTNAAVISGGTTYDVIAQLGSGTTVLTGVGSTNEAQVLVIGGQLNFEGGNFNNSNASSIYVGYRDQGGSFANLSNSSQVTVNISSNAIVSTYSFQVGHGDSNSYNSNNWALVTGSGTELNSAQLYVGNYGNENLLTVSNQATVTVGYYSLTVGNLGNSNAVVISGAGSTINSSDSPITVGIYGTNNSILVSSGGLLYGCANANTNSGYGDIIGYGGSTNQILVTGAGSLFSNNSALNVGYGLPQEGGVIAVNNDSLVISNGASASLGTLFLGELQNDVSNSVMVYGNSTLTVGGNSTVGYNDSSSNLMMITGNNSLFTNSGNLHIGYGSSVGSVDNSLVVSNGANVSIGGALYLGNISGDTANSVYVYGNSTLSVTGTSYIGNGDSDSNTVTVTGSNAVFTSIAGLDIGNGNNASPGSVGNSLVITNGGSVRVSNASGVILGSNPQDSQNHLILSGNGSVLTDGGQLKVGQSGSSNSLVISGGAEMLVTGTHSWIGKIGGSDNNSVIVTGGGSLLSNSSEFDIGGSGSANTLLITNSGSVSVGGDSYVGKSSGASNNLISIVGSGSQFLVAGNLYVGDGTDANTLSLNNGAFVSAASITVYTNSLLTGNGTITDPTINGGTFAPAGTNALTLNGNLSFTNAGIYAWNLFNNSASTNGGTNFTVPVVLNGNLSVTTNSLFDLNFSGAVNGSSSFWTNSQQWQVVAGTNSLSAGTNFGLAWANPAASAGFNLADFSLSASNNNFYLNYNAPLITNPTIAAGTNTALPSYNQGSNTVLVITAPTNGTAVLSGTNPALTGIFVNSGTLASTNQNSIPTNANVTVYGGTMGFTGPGTNIIGSLFVSGGSVAASNTIVQVQSYVQTGGTLSGGSNATYWSDNYYFAASNTATVNAKLDNLYGGTGGGITHHSTAVVTTNSSGAPAAPVVFDNNMSYDGGTVITGGILQLGSSNSTGAVTVQGNITNNGFLNFGFNGNSTTPTNVVIGSGVIGQIGTGTLTIGTNGIDNSFTGSFGVANGTLAITTNSALGGSTNFYLASGGTLQATTGVTNITNVNVTNGTGIIDNASSNTLTLNGTLTKSGTVLVLAGGDFQVNAQVTGSGGLGSFNSDLVVSNATATLNSGNNNYSGPTYVVAGSSLSNGIINALPSNTVLTVGATSDGSVTNRYDMAGYNQTLAGLSSAGSAANIVTNTGSPTILNINGSQSTTYGGLITGSIGLTRAGTGAITLTNNNTYAGGTTISSGKIVTLANQSLGTGTVGLSGGSLEIHSLLNIGAFTWTGGQVAIPTLTSANGVYLLSTNGLTIGGASHVFNLSGASLTIGTPTRLLGATNMSTNSFSTSEFSVSGVGNYSLLIYSNTLWIDLLNNPAPAAVSYPNFVGYAVNRNQTNVALALNSFTNNPNADQTAVLTSLTALTNSPGSMQQAFNAIMPNFYQQMATIAFNSANAQNMELSQRLWGMRVAEGGGFSMNGFGDNTPMIQEGQGDGDGKGVLDAKKDILRPGLDNRWGMFLDANGIFAQANSGNMLPGYQSESGGVTTGLTYKWNKNVSSGIYAGYQGTYDKLGAAGSGLGVGSTLIDNAVRFGFFGTYGQVNSKGEPLGFYANALAGGAYNNYQASRIIQYPGINRTATSQPGAGELDSMIAGGYDLKAGNFTYGPSASLQYTYLGANGVNETGAQSLDYNSSGWNSSSMLSSVGAHGAYTWMVNKLEGHEVAVVPQISLNWQHEFMQNPYAINGNLGGTTPNFSNWSATPIRDFLYTGVGVTVEFAKRWNTSFFYNAAAGNKDLVSQSIFLSAGLKF